MITHTAVHRLERNLNLFGFDCRQRGVLKTLQWFCGAAAAALLATSSTASPGQMPAPTIHVGDGTIDGSIIGPYDNSWLVTVRYGDGRRDERGLSSDHVRFRTISGMSYLTRIEATALISGKPDAAPAASVSMTFNVFDPLSMRPATGVEYASDGTRTQHDFSEHGVSTTSGSSEKAAGTSVGTSLPEPVYDFNGGMAGLLIAALPLKPGYCAVLPILGEKGFDTQQISVVRQETILAGRLGSRETFVVQIGAQPSTETYWISKSAPYVIKVEERAPNAIVTWDMT